MRKLKRKHKVKELDLLPVMNLFSILVTIVISMATFEKMGVLELALPERSTNPTDQKQDIDPGLLNLTVIITKSGITLGAAGGFQPTVFYQEEVEYRSKSDKNVFRKAYVKGEEVRSPTDGKVMTPAEKETIFLHAVEKKDSTDPGKYTNVAVNVDGDAMMDTGSNWYSSVPQAGQKYRVVGDDVFRTMDASTARYCAVAKLSAYQEVARQLEKIHKLYSQRDPLPADVDDVVILAEEDIIYDKIIQLMDACKSAGFEKVSLSLIGAGA